MQVPGPKPSEFLRGTTLGTPNLPNSQEETIPDPKPPKSLGGYHSGAPDPLGIHIHFNISLLRPRLLPAFALLLPRRLLFCLSLPPSGVRGAALSEGIGAL